MPKVELEIQCKSCQGTGVYSGMGESRETAVICQTCSGSGKQQYSFQYEEFTGRKIKDGIKRVYKSGYGYKIGLGKINFDKIGEIDMDKEGVSYEEFLNGKKPGHIKQLGCPMMADQSACHKIKGFTEKCNKLHGSYLSYIPDCNNRKNKLQCWERFENGTENI